MRNTYSAKRGSLFSFSVCVYVLCLPRDGFIALFSFETLQVFGNAFHPAFRCGLFRFDDFQLKYTQSHGRCVCLCEKMCTREGECEDKRIESMHHWNDINLCKRTLMSFMHRYSFFCGFNACESQFLPFHLLNGTRVICRQPYGYKKREVKWKHTRRHTQIYRWKKKNRWTQEKTNEIGTNKNRECFDIVKRQQIE